MNVRYQRHTDQNGSIQTCKGALERGSHRHAGAPSKTANELSSTLHRLAGRMPRSLAPIDVSLSKVTCIFQTCLHGR